MEELKSEVVSKFVQLMQESDATQNIFALISRAHEDRELGLRCADPSYELIWQKLWQKCLKPELPLFIIPHRSSYKLLAGMCYYKHYQETQDVKYLQIAANSYRNFQALELLIEQHLTTQVNPSQALQKAMLIGQQAQGHYPCAGALLCANISFAIATRAQASEEPEKAVAAYQETLDQLWTAHKLAPHSEQELHNAYLGRGIKASNPWKVDNTWDLIMFLLNMLEKSPYSPNADLAETRANRCLLAYEKMLNRKTESPRKKAKVTVF